MNKKKLIIIIASIIVLALAFRIVWKVTHPWTVTVTTDYINVRTDSSVVSPLMGKVEKGEKLKVIRVYTEDYYYYWYYVKVNNYRKGWIASAKQNPFVEEKNAPKDYTVPILKYNEEVYKTKNEKTITYDHLYIKDNSKVKITHKIKKDGGLYWITYTVTDKAGNKTSKTQRIEFEEKQNEKNN